MSDERLDEQRSWRDPERSGEEAAWHEAAGESAAWDEHSGEDAASDEEGSKQSEDVPAEWDEERTRRADRADERDELAAEPETSESEPLPDGFGPCPTCGEPVDPRQLVCLNCGGRVALTHGRSFVTEPLVPLIVAVVVVGAALFGFAISEITSDSGDGPRVAAESAAPAPAVVDGEGQRERSDAGREQQDTTGTARKPAPRSPSRSLEWPAGVTAHTVVLVTTSDRAAALGVAREARSTGLEAGLLPSDPYNLGSGLWIVFTGRFTTREGAARQAAQLARRYPGAYPQLIQRSQ
jgi:hypothetical protein